MSDKQLIDTGEKKERFILVGLKEEGELDELALLLETAGAQEAGRLVQSREGAHPVTYIGKGKLEELKIQLLVKEADGIVCDDELSAAQLSALSRELDCKVLDRTLLILDIFAGRADSMEGKLQVELAQQKYRAAHLTGLGKELSRLGGGIGTRGPGEKKLEMDKRQIRERITRLKRELADVRRHRAVLREKREDKGMITAALVGYTSAGKSTILNRLTKADVMEDAMLFSTLDTTTRVLALPSGREILLTDTVGFIRKLPHDLVEAFKSTLEEITFADVIIHVVDAADPQAEEKMHTVYETLRSLQVRGKPVMTVFNKADLIGRCTNEETDMETEEMPLRDIRADMSVFVSAAAGYGMEKMKTGLEELLRREQIYVERLIPYADSSFVARIRKEGQIVSEEYTSEGIAVKAYIPRRLL